MEFERTLKIERSVRESYNFCQMSWKVRELFQMFKISCDRAVVLVLVLMFELLNYTSTGSMYFVVYMQLLDIDFV